MKIEAHVRYHRDGRWITPRHGGVQARRWRRKVARAAVKAPEQSLKTLTFPLDLSLPAAAFEVADELYNAIEGTGEGSLVRLLLRVHLAGVGLFQGVKEADSFRSAAAFPDDAFVAALREELGVDLPKLTPRRLFDLFRTPPKKSVPFDLAGVAGRIHASVTGKGLDERVQGNERLVVHTIAGAVLATCRDFTDLSERAAEALAEAGRALARICPSVPSLGVVIAQESGGIPLAFTGTVDPVSDDAPEEYWLHHVVACLLRRDPDAKPGEVQDALLSYSNNALSNLFGVALFTAKGGDGKLRSLGCAELCSVLGVPPERTADARMLHAALRAVPRPGLFREAHYAAYRPAIGGKLRSWVANYLTRLRTLEKQVSSLQTLPLPASREEAVDRVLEGLGLSVPELAQMMTARGQAIASVKDALAVLSGRDAGGSPVACASALEQGLRTIREIHGHFEAVANQIRQLLEDGAQPGLAAWEKALTVGDADLYALPRMTGGNQDTDSEIEAFNSQLHRLLDGLAALRQLAGEGGGGFADFLANLAADESQRARAVPSRRLEPEAAVLLAKRRFLASLARLATRLSPDSAERVWSWLQPLVIDPRGNARAARKIFNRLRFNRQGRFHVSPWSPARHQPLEVDFVAFERADWFGRLEQLARDVEAALAASASAALLQDHIEMQRFETQARIDARTGGVEAARIRALLDIDALGAHYRLRMALAEDTVGRKGLSGILTLLGSHLARMRFVARRERFVVRQKFSRVGQDDVLYVPKDKAWAMPPKYREAKGIIGQLLRTDLVPDGDGPLRVMAVFDAASQMAPDTGVGHFLRQLPHDWYLPMELASAWAPQVQGLPVGKDTVRRPEAVRKLVREQAARLIGPSSFLNQLSGMLVRQTEAKEWMLILDWLHRAEVVMRGGRPCLSASLEGCRARVAIPVESNAESDEKFEFFDHFVAVDLGERQIGYAVFGLKDALAQQLPQVIVDPDSGRPASGAIRVPGVRRLINSIRSHRGSQAANAKLRQSFDRKLEELRENVCADIVQRIEALCARFKAFTVLESSVVNFQTGSRQLDLVYGDVVRRFTYSDVDAHTRKRVEHWFGGERWQHPYLMEQKFDPATGKRAGRANPLNLFPGVTVNPAGTSQTCIHCGRNAVLALRGLGDGAVTVLEDGRVMTASGEVRLLAGWNYTDEQFRAARRQKLNLPMNEPMKPGQRTAQEVMTALRRTMRQKNPYIMARDTTQSRFQCAFSDCGQTYHADQGAAVNIGRKFLAERIDRQASAERLRGLLDLG